MPSICSATLRDTLYDSYLTDISSFIEVRNGWRTARNQDEKDASIAEARLQLDLTTDLSWAILKLKTDFVGDFVEEETRAELRDLSISFSPLDNVDIKAGRQIITWGTGDLVFINDLFAKDWESFFIGRDTEYLKAPSDALKTSIFWRAATLDLVYVPIFNGSQFIDGTRISYWNNLSSKIGDRALTVQDEERNRFGNDSEFAARLSKNITGTELAFYLYSGFWKTPEGVNPATFDLIYPRLSVYGLSLRAPVLGGIGNIETGYYDSRQDTAGSDPFIRNSEARFLAGFEHELGPDFTGAFQYYLEWMQDYDQYAKNFTGTKATDEYRHLFSVRLTQLLMNQTLTLSLFTYYSPSDHDAYLRPIANYKISDQWTLEAGGNIFIGKDDQTFFGQFEDNTNFYTSLRWSY
jgi:hypothetical protein